MDFGSPLVLLLLLIPALPNLFAIWHAFSHTFPSPQERLLWVCFSVFVPVIGGLCYLLFGMRRATGKWTQ